ncbi:malonate transporter subunit MadL [Pseudomonas kuykendallii]|uniref:Malonate transporter subunit MadL n=1 Tax=Pseudomonas kuykendallii TaxID=1007099 RepID=A0A2W5CYX0_9PSED|nr:malonate transporter subunit MadL [Pseudomonas kuykendallii]PZP22674.1 MAG: malonate transporter subunit MadL [Pseudomonas kuykendallii]
MIIYGVAFLAFCTLAGIFIGELLGKLIGVPANVGGVGIAMMLLIFVGSYLQKRGILDATSEKGITFWSAVYIPIVVAMAAQQNVYGALSGGPMAIIAGTLAVVVSFALVPALSRVGQKKPDSIDSAPLTKSPR